MQDYGVWVEKKMFGKKYMGTNRSTYLIDEEGIIINVNPKAKVSKNAEELLDILRK